MWAFRGATTQLRQGPGKWVSIQSSREGGLCWGVALIPLLDGASVAWGPALQSWEQNRSRGVEIADAPSRVCSGVH